MTSQFRIIKYEFYPLLLVSSTKYIHKTIQYATRIPYDYPIVWIYIMIEICSFILLSFVSPPAFIKYLPYDLSNINEDVKTNATIPSFCALSYFAFVPPLNYLLFSFHFRTVRPVLFSYLTTNTTRTTQDEQWQKF